jgi:hypothetical protein
MKPPKLEDLMCLTAWPEGTAGYKQEEEAIKVVLVLMEQQGIGHIAQMVAGIEYLWRNPAKQEEYRAWRKAGWTFWQLVESSFTTLLYREGCKYGKTKQKSS